MSAGMWHSSAEALFRTWCRGIWKPRAIAAILLAALVPACGRNMTKGTLSSPGTLMAVSSTPPGVQSGVIALNYTLSNPAGFTCTLAVSFSVDGGATFKPATPGPGGDGTADLASSAAGTARVFDWNSLADGVALGAPVGTVRIRLTPADTAPGTSSTTANFTVDNSADTPPSASMTTPSGTQGGLVPIAYSLIDAESDPCSLQVLFSIDGGTSFAAATQGPGGDGIVDLPSSPAGGTAHGFLWNSVADGVAPSGVNAAVQIRLLPADGRPGAATTTGSFAVDNSGRSSGASFGGAYPLQVNSTSHSDWATAMATDGQSLWTVGFENFDFESPSGADSTWRLEKRTIQTGALVGGFGAGGFVSVNPGPGLDLPFKVIQSGAYVYVLGAQETGLKSQSFILRIEKRSALTGALINSFGSGGVVLTSSTAGQDGVPLPWTMALDGSFMYIAGPQSLSAADSGWRIEKRDKTTGQRVASFGIAGVVDENPTGQIDGCFAIVIDSSSMWLVGAEGVDGTSSSNGRIRIEKRTLLDGSLVTGFGTGGSVIVDAGPGDDLGEDAVSDGSYLYTYSRVETSAGSGLFHSRIEKRNLVTGALSGTAVTGGATDPSGDMPFAHLVLDGGALFLCQTDGSADAQWYIEKRLSTDLSLVPSFGAAGLLQINPSVGGYDRPLGLAVAGGVLLLAGMDSAASDQEWRLEARWR
jgi:hypothetical protein